VSLRSGVVIAAVAALLFALVGCSGTRTLPAPPSDGGAPGDGGLDASTVCSSGTSWTNGTRRSPYMEPGMACIACHLRSGRAPQFDVAGTVYARAHEPDACNGTSAASVVVVLTDANGAEYRLPVNVVGNFTTQRSGIVMPYLARVEYAGRTRAMIAPQTSGDCNACHTAAGTTITAGAAPAPGRIMLP